MGRSREGVGGAAAAAALFLGALALRLLLFARHYAHDEALFGKYLWAAREAGAGSLTAERFSDFSLLYTLLVGGLMKLFGDAHLPYKAVTMILGAVNCVLVAGLAFRLFGAAAGFVAGLGAACYLPFILHDFILEPATLLMFLNLAGLLLSLAAARRREAGGGGLLLWAAAGLLLGLAVLTRPNALLLLSLVLLWALFLRRAGGGGGAAAAATAGGSLCAGAVVVLLLHPFAGAGAGALMSSGQVLYQGNNPAARGYYGAHPPLLKEMEVDPAVNRGDEPDYAHELYRLFARESGAAPETYWRERSQHYLTAYPRAALELLARKVRYFWTGREVHDVIALYSLERAMSGLPLAGFGAVVPLALAGIVLLLRRRNPGRGRLLPLAAASAFFLSNLVFFVSSRQRLQAVPFLIPYAAAAAVALAAAARDLWQSRGRDWKRMPWAAAAVAAAAALLVNGPAPELAHFEAALSLNSDSRLQARRAGEALARGDLAEARSRYALSFDLMPFHPTRAPNALAGGAAGKVRRAADFWEEVHRRDPGEDYPRFTLAALLQRAGRHDEAAALLDGLAREGFSGFMGNLLPLADPRYLRARSLAALEREGEAVELLREVERRRPGLGRTRALLAALAAKRGDGAEARRWSAALGELENRLSAGWLLAEAHFLLGEDGDALRALEEAESPLLRRFAPFHFLRSAALARLGLAAAPGGGRVRLLTSSRDACRAGLSLGSRGNEVRPESAAALRALVEEGGEGGATFLLLGIAAYHLGDLDEARGALAAALAGSDLTEEERGSAALLLAEVERLSSGARPGGGIP